MSEIPLHPNDVPGLNPPKLTHEERTIRNLKKKLKRTQNKVERLTIEAGTRFLTSQAAKFMTLLIAERAAHDKTKRQLSDVSRDLEAAKRHRDGITMDSLRELVARAEAASKK